MSPASMAGLPVRSALVEVPPPLLVSEPSLASAISTMLPVVLPSMVQGEMEVTVCTRLCPFALRCWRSTTAAFSAFSAACWLKKTLA